MLYVHKITGAVCLYTVVPAYRNRFALLLAAMLLGLAVAACEQEELNWPDNVVWSSEHFRYHTRSEDVEACEDTLIALEQNFSTMQAYLGFEWPEGEKIEYYKYVNLDDFNDNSPCQSWSAGCTASSSDFFISAHSPQIFHRHELIHTYVFQKGSPFILLTEGLAETLSGRAFWNALSPPDLSFEEAISLGYDDSAYAAGMWFVGHLLHQHGPKTIMKLYETLDGVEDTAQIDWIFEKQLGESAVEIWDRMIQEADYTKALVPVWQCTSPELSLDDNSEEILEGGCETPITTRTIKLDEDVTIALSGTGGFFHIGSCDGQPTPKAQLGIDPAFVMLQAGKYFIEPLYNDGETPDEPVHINASITTLAWLNQECLQAQEAWELTYNEDFSIHLPADQETWYMRLKIDPQSFIDSIHINAQIGIGEDSNQQVMLCDSCEMLNCMQVTLNTIFPIEKQEYVVVIKPSPAWEHYISLHFSAYQFTN